MKIVFIYLFIFLPSFFSLHLMANVQSNASEPDSNSTVFSPLDFPLTRSPEEQLTSGGSGGFQPYDFRPGGGGSSSLPLFIMLGNGGSKNPPPSSGSDQSASGNTAGQPPVTLSISGSKLSGNNQASGGALPPPEPPPKTECTLKNYLGFFTYINQLMTQLNGVVTLMVDKDDTILMDKGDNQLEIRRAFYWFVIHWRAMGKLRLVIVTRGQLSPDEWNYFSENELPEPDVLISGTEYGAKLIMARPGTNITSPLRLWRNTSSQVAMLGNGGVYITKYLDFIKEGMASCQNALAQQGIPVVSPSPQLLVTDSTVTQIVNTSPNYNLSNQGNRQRILNTISQHLGVFGGINFDSTNNRFFISAPISKGRILFHLSRILQLKNTFVIVAGDSEEDLSMMFPHEQAEFTVYTAILTGATNLGLIEHANIANTQRTNHIPLEIEKAPALQGVIRGLAKALYRLVSQQNNGENTSI